MVSLSLLWRRFLKIGATAYGGPAIAGHMKTAIVKEYGWMRESEFLQALAFCQMLPGPIFLMLSAYIGYRLRGIWGAFSCAVAFILPPSSWIVFLSFLYSSGSSLAVIQSLFQGAGSYRRGSVLHAVISFGRPILPDWKMILIAVLSFFGFLLRWNILLSLHPGRRSALLLGCRLLRLGLGSTRKDIFPRKRRFLIWAGLAVLLGDYLACSGFNPDGDFSSLLAKIGRSFGGAFTHHPPDPV
jgi:chromate transporter